MLVILTVLYTEIIVLVVDTTLRTYSASEDGLPVVYQSSGVISE